MENFFVELLDHIANDIMGASDGTIDKSTDLSVVDFLADRGKDELAELMAPLVDEPNEQQVASIAAMVLQGLVAYLKGKQ